MAKSKKKEKKNAKKEIKKKEKEREKEAKPAKKPERKPAPKEEDREGYRGIVRIAGKDMRGHIPFKRSLLRVRGISHGLTNSIAASIKKELGIAPDMKVGELTDEQIEKIDKILFSLSEHNLPSFILNRRCDFDSGKDRHVIMNDLVFTESQDVERSKKEYSWKGYRHAYGQKVRGQKTRNTGRKGMAVGVLRKAIIAQQKGGAKKEDKKK